MNLTELKIIIALHLRLLRKNRTEPTRKSIPNQNEKISFRHYGFCSYNDLSKFVRET